MTKKASAHIYHPFQSGQVAMVWCSAVWLLEWHSVLPPIVVLQAVGEGGFHQCLQGFVSYSYRHVAVSVGDAGGKGLRMVMASRLELLVWVT